MKTTMIAALAVGAIGVAAYALVDEFGAAKADTARGACISSTAIITHGGFRRLPDAGFMLEVCGRTLFADGGLYPDPSPCTPCEPGGLNTDSIATCRREWQQLHCP